MEGAGFSFKSINPKLTILMFSFVVLCILGSNESVYLRVLRDVSCEISNLNN